MIFELLYTSVPKGLKPGAKGYCTVLTTEGIPSALLERLEGYCGYRHLFSPGSPDNPEAFGHRILNLAGNTWHILSRVADAGSDYSGRSNLIGHFMAISQDELKGISAGPTSFMMSDGFFRTVLEGEPRRVSESETRNRLGNVTDKAQKALTWATVTCHAGWAGRLVQVTEESSDSIALVYPLRTNTLKLLDEAASILPKYKQWDITFNTFFTKSGEECRWRCYCADVDEASPFKGGEFDLVKVKRIGEPPVESPYAEAATNGKNKVGASPAAKPASGAKARTPIKSNSEKSLEAGQSFVDKRKAKREDDDFHTIINKDTKKPSVKPTQHSLEVLPRQAGPLPPPVNRAPRSIDLLNDMINEGKNSRNRKSQIRDPFKIAFYVTAALLFFVVLIFAGIEIIRSKPNNAVVETTKGDAKKSDPSADKAPDEKGDSKAAPKDATTGPGKVAAAPKDATTGPGKVAAVPKDATTGPGKLAAAPKDAAEAMPKVPVVTGVIVLSDEAIKTDKVNSDIKVADDVKGAKKTVIVHLESSLKKIVKDENLLKKAKAEGLFVQTPSVKLKPNTSLPSVTNLKGAGDFSFEISAIESDGFRLKMKGEPKEDNLLMACFSFTQILNTADDTVVFQFLEPIGLIQHLKDISVKEVDKNIPNGLSPKPTLFEYSNNPKDSQKYNLIYDLSKAVGDSVLKLNSEEIFAVIDNGFCFVRFFDAKLKQIDLNNPDPESPRIYASCNLTLIENVGEEPLFKVEKFKIKSPLVWSDKEPYGFKPLLFGKYHPSLPVNGNPPKNRNDLNLNPVLSSNGSLLGYMINTEAHSLCIEIIKKLNDSIKNGTFGEKLFKEPKYKNNLKEGETIEVALKRYFDSLTAKFKNLQKYLTNGAPQFQISYMIAYRSTSSVPNPNLSLEDQAEIDKDRKKEDEQRQKFKGISLVLFNYQP